MRILITFLLVFFSSEIFSQNCETFFTQDKFTHDKEVSFFLTGIEGYKPYVMFTLKVLGDKPYSDNQFSIECSAGTGKKDPLVGVRDFNSLTMNYASITHNNVMLYLLFEDGNSFELFTDPNTVYNNSVNFDKQIQPKLFSYLKSKRVTDVRFIFNNIQSDYKVLPYSTNASELNQTFFINAIKCLNW